MKINVQMKSTDPNQSVLLYNFRHGSELEKEAKGGYLQGTIEIEGSAGSGHQVESIELDLVENEDGDVHPNTLYINKAARKQRTADGLERQETIRASDCFVTLNFEGNNAFVKTSYFREDLLLTDVWDSKSCTLKLGGKGLRLTIVKPIQKGKNKNSEDMFIKNVLDNKLEKPDADFDVDSKVKRFSAIRKPNSVRNSSRMSPDAGKGSLFKVYLQVSVKLTDGSSIRTISKEPFYDKGKYNFEVDTVTPNIICSKGNHCITILMKTCKVTTNIGVEYKLRDPTNGNTYKPHWIDRKSGYFRLYFKKPNDEITSDSLRLEMKIMDGNQEGPMCPSKEIEVWRHNEVRCPWCELSKKDWTVKEKAETKGGKRTKNETSEPHPTPRKRVLMTTQVPTASTQPSPFFSSNIESNETSPEVADQPTTNEALLSQIFNFKSPDSGISGGNSPSSYDSGDAMQTIGMNSPVDINKIRFHETQFPVYANPMQIDEQDVSNLQDPTEELQNILDSSLSRNYVQSLVEQNPYTPVEPLDQDPPLNLPIPTSPIPIGQNESGLDAEMKTLPSCDVNPEEIFKDYDPNSELKDLGRDNSDLEFDGGSISQVRTAAQVQAQIPEDSAGHDVQVVEGTDYKSLFIIIFAVFLALFYQWWSSGFSGWDEE